MKCPICGNEIGRFVSDTRAMEEHGKCFSCEIWEDRYNKFQKLPKDQHSIAIIDGTFYTIGDENDPSPFRGFGGDKFVIRFKDGKEIITTNLWCGGDIDPYWQKYLPNNADFDWQWKRIGTGQYLVPKEKG